VAAKKTKKNYGRSLALAKFHLNLERLLRAHAFFECAGEYAARWWEDQPPPPPARITGIAGDNGEPFSAIDVTPQAYLEAGQDARVVLRALTVVGIAASFETFLYDVHRRALHIKPALLETSKAEFTASELVEAERASEFRWWLAQKVTGRRLRGVSHVEMVERVAKLIRADVHKGNNKTQMDAWARWALVRNSIAHSSMTVGLELAATWKQRFPCQTPPSWGQVPGFSPTSWGQPIARVMGPPARCMT
jgi:hypothetical protein